MTGHFRPLFAWALLTVVASAFVGLFVSFQAGVWLLFFAIAAWWVWEHPEEGFLLLLVAAPLLPMLKITQTVGFATLLKDVIIGVLFLKLVAVPLVCKHLPYRRNVFLAPLVALVLWAALETLRADSLLLGILRARDILLYAVLFGAVLYLEHTPEKLRERLRWFMATVAVLLGLGIYQWFFAGDSAVLRFDPVREVWIPRISSVLAHPSIFGQYLIAAASLLGGLVLAGMARQRAVFGALWLLLLPFIFLTYSRAVWLGLAAASAAQGTAMILRLAQQKVQVPWKRYALPASILMLLGFLLFVRFTPAGTFLRSAFDPTYASNEERLEFLVRLVGPLTNTEALFGKGLGDVLAQNFREADVTAFDIAAGDARAVQLTKNRTLVDNQYLKTLIEMGLTGLLIYGWLYWRFAAAALRLALRGEKSEQHVLGVTGLGFLAAFVIQAFFIDIWDIFPTNALFWILAAHISAASGTVHRHNNSVRP